MSLDSTDVQDDASAAPSTRSGRRAAASAAVVVDDSRRVDWRLGARTVHPWRSQVLAVVLLSEGVSVLLGTVLTLVLLSWGGLVATAVLWLGMLVPIVGALSRSRPAGQLRFGFLDLLWASGSG